MYKVIKIIATIITLMSYSDVTIGSCSDLERNSNTYNLVSHNGIGNSKSGQIQFFTANQYLNALASDKILPTQIIFLEKFPTIAPPVYVSAIVTVEEMSDMSHQKVFAQILGIPILQISRENFQSIKGGFQNKEDPWGKLTYDTNKRTLNLQNSAGLEKFVLPRSKNPIEGLKNLDLRYRKIISLEEMLENSLSEISLGDKIFQVVEAAKDETLREKLPKNIFALPFGLLDRYLEETVLSDGTNFRQLITKNLESLKEAGSFQDIVVTLANIRNTFRANPLSDDTLHSIITKISHAYPSQNSVTIRARGSAYPEDRLGAGVYDSVKIELNLNDLVESKEKLSVGVTEIWASLYTFRAYVLRRFFNLDETNISIAVFIHQSIDNQISHGIVEKQSSAEGIFTNMLACDGTTCATSPTLDAKKDNLQIFENMFGTEKYNFVLNDAGLLNHSSIESLVGMIGRIDDKKTEVTNKGTLIEYLTFLDSNDIEKIVLLQIKDTPVNPLLNKQALKFTSQKASPTLIANHEKDLKLLNQYGKLIDTLDRGNVTFYPTRVFRDFHLGTISELAYFYVSIEGKKHLLVGNHHELNYNHIIGSFSSENVGIEILNTGRISLEVEESGGKIIVDKIQIRPNSSINTPMEDRYKQGILLSLFRDLATYSTMSVSGDTKVQIKHLLYSKLPKPLILTIKNSENLTYQKIVSLLEKI